MPMHTRTHSQREGGREQEVGREGGKEGRRYVGGENLIEKYWLVNGVSTVNILK